MPLPIAHGIVGAAIVAGLGAESSSKLNWKAFLLGAALAIFPDCDLLFVWGLGLKHEWHGGFSHSIVFAFAGAILCAMVMHTPTPRATLVYGLAMVSHGFLDAATSRLRGGVELFWPYSSKRIKIGSFGYIAFFPDPSTDRLVDLLFRVLRISLLEIALFSPVLLLVIWMKHRSLIKTQRTLQTRSSPAARGRAGQ